MTVLIDRRSLIVTGTLGLAGLALPGFAQMPDVRALAGFTHGVASGEPDAQSVLLWTRYVPAGGGDARVAVELSETPDFARIAGGGAMTTGPWRDHSVKVTVAGLKSGTRYHYRFVAPDGTRSPVGRTMTLPDAARRLRIAVFSCSNMGFGWFNAYAHAAARGDLDLAFHLGDYLYEYAPGGYPSPADTVPGRDFAPTHEAIALADYRLRYASYRGDPDLQALHAAMPMLVSMDDHESANNSWEGGAQNHGADEGDWAARRGAAIQAFREWMPVSDEPWKAYDVGGLATIYRTDTRLAARSRGPEIAGGARAGDAAIAAFRDGAWRDPAATMMGSAQEAWLADALRRSVRAGRRWQLVGFGTNMGFQRTPADAVDWVPASAPASVRAGIAARVALGRAGLPQDLDNWGGYPAARARFLGAVQAAGADAIVISGDSHNAWAYELANDGARAAVEFGGQSVTSGGIENSLRGVDPARIARTLVAANPELKWCDTARRGYMALTLEPARATNEWVFVDTVATRSPRASVGQRATVLRGARRLQL